MLPSYRSCLVHPVDRFDSEGLEGLLSSDQVIFLTVVRVFVTDTEIIQTYFVR